MFSENDVDWVPSKNLTNIDQQDEQDHDFDSDLSRTCFAASFRKSSMLSLIQSLSSDCFLNKTLCLYR